MKEPLIKTFAKKSGKSETYIKNLWDEIASELAKQGIAEGEKRFYPYLTTKLKKQLEIKETSTVLKRFKTFLHERQPE